MILFVAVFFVVKIITALGISLYAYVTESEPPVIATPVTIAAIGLALVRFSKVVNRPMTGKETFAFATGNTLADICLSAAWLLAMMWLSSIPMSWESVAIILGGNRGVESAQTGLIIGLVIGSFQILALSAFFAWLITKKLPKSDPQSTDAD
jgi:hypothetical protein